MPPKCSVVRPDILGSQYVQRRLVPLHFTKVYSNAIYLAVHLVLACNWFLPKETLRKSGANPHLRNQVPITIYLGHNQNVEIY